jgi:hypothetical protein
MHLHAFQSFPFSIDLTPRYHSILKYPYVNQSLHFPAPAPAPAPQKTLAMTKIMRLAYKNEKNILILLNLDHFRALRKITTVLNIGLFSQKIE